MRKAKEDMYDEKGKVNIGLDCSFTFLLQVSTMYSERRKRLEAIQSNPKKSMKKKKKVKVTNIEEEDEEESDDDRVGSSKMGPLLGECTGQI